MKPQQFFPDEILKLKKFKPLIIGENMSMDFCAVICTDDLNLAKSVISVTHRLIANGFRPDDSVSNHTDPGKLPAPPDRTSTVRYSDFIQGAGESWTACSISYYAEGMTLDIIIQRYPREFANIHVAVNANIIWQAWNTAIFRLFFLALTEIATSVEAYGGIGGFDLAVDRLSPDSLHNAVINNPDNPGFPVDMAFINRDNHHEKFIQMCSDKGFRIIEMPQHWLLIHDDFEKLLRSTRST